MIGGCAEMKPSNHHHHQQQQALVFLLNVVHIRIRLKYYLHNDNMKHHN